MAQSQLQSWNLEAKICSPQTLPNFYSMHSPESAFRKTSDLTPAMGKSRRNLRWQFDKINSFYKSDTKLADIGNRERLTSPFKQSNNVMIKRPTARSTSRGNLSSNSTPESGPKVIIGRARSMSGLFNDKSLEGPSLSKKYLLKTQFLSRAITRRTNNTSVSMQNLDKFQWTNEHNNSHNRKSTVDLPARLVKSLNS